MDNHLYSATSPAYECLAGVGATEVFEASSADFFTSLSDFVRQNNDWLFGHFGYDLKNKVEPGLQSNNFDGIQFPGYFLFIPATVLKLQGKELTIGSLGAPPEEIYGHITREAISPPPAAIPIHFTARLSKQEYLQSVSGLQDHIKNGDCYVINFCQEFLAGGNIDPVNAFNKLSQVSPNPFSAFYRLQDKWVLCASPERYLKKVGNKIISQPIKGTSSRYHNDPQLDAEAREELLKSEKERSENVMVVDLVRNDLSKVCQEGSVNVDELFGIYSFPNVHQMISTVSGKLLDRVGFGEILKATFPMGSMTGAPKRKVMELIEEFEKTKRGVYSGTIGYVSPDKDFDFNVIIRSLVYNESQNYLSFHTGSAITSYSDPEKEYEECLLKGKALSALFTDNSRN